MEFIPVNSMLLVQLTQPRKMTRAGIIIPEEAKRRITPIVFAKVLAKGQGEILESGQRDNVDCEEGDWIAISLATAALFPIEYTGDTVQSGDIPDRALMFFEHVMAKVQFAEGEEPTDCGEEVPVTNAPQNAQNGKPKLVLARDAGALNGMMQQRPNKVRKN